MGDQLESSNFSKEKITSTVQQEIEDRIWKRKFKDLGIPRDQYHWHSGHFYATMRKQQWGNSKYSKNSPEQETDNSSDFEPKVPEDAMFREQRQDDLTFFKKLKNELPDILEMMIDVLQKDYVVITENNKEQYVQLDWAAYYGDAEAVELNKMLKDNITTWLPQFQRMLDTRQKLLPNQMSVLIAVKEVSSTISYFCSRYYSKVKVISGISTKAYRKYLNETNSMSAYLDFCQEDPWKHDVMFFRCPKCRLHKLKVRILPNGTWNFVCKNKKAHKHDVDITFPSEMFIEQLNKIIENRGGAATKIANREKIEIPDD